MSYIDLGLPTLSAGAARSEAREAAKPFLNALKAGAKNPSKGQWALRMAQSVASYSSVMALLAQTLAIDGRVDRAAPASVAEAAALLGRISRRMAPSARHLRESEQKEWVVLMSRMKEAAINVDAHRRGKGVHSSAELARQVTGVLRIAASLAESFKGTRAVNTASATAKEGIDMVQFVAMYLSVRVLTARLARASGILSAERVAEIEGEALRSLSANEPMAGPVLQQLGPNSASVRFMSTIMQARKYAAAMQRVMSGGAGGDDFMGSLASLGLRGPEYNASAAREARVAGDPDFFSASPGPEYTPVVPGMDTLARGDVVSEFGTSLRNSTRADPEFSDKVMGKPVSSRRRETFQSFARPQTAAEARATRLEAARVNSQLPMTAQAFEARSASSGPTSSPAKGFQSATTSAARKYDDLYAPASKSPERGFIISDIPSAEELLVADAENRAARKAAPPQPAGLVQRVFEFLKYYVGGAFETVWNGAAWFLGQIGELGASVYNFIGAYVSKFAAAIGWETMSGLQRTLVVAVVIVAIVMVLYVLYMIVSYLRRKWKQFFGRAKGAKAKAAKVAAAKRTIERRGLSVSTIAVLKSQGWTLV